MPRLRRSEVEVRNAWVSEQFCKDPSISGPVMSKMVTAQFGNTMRAKQIYALRDEVLRKLKWTKGSFGNPIPGK